MADGVGAGGLESREAAARERIERLRDEADRILAELEDAEVVLERLVIARETVAEVLAPPAGRAPEAGATGTDAVPAEVGRWRGRWFRIGVTACR